MPFLLTYMVYYLRNTSEWAHAREKASRKILLGMPCADTYIVVRMPCTQGYTLTRLHSTE